jgi:hypothetical protein
VVSVQITHVLVLSRRCAEKTPTTAASAPLIPPVTPTDRTLPNASGSSFSNSVTTPPTTTMAATWMASEHGDDLSHPRPQPKAPLVHEDKLSDSHDADKPPPQIAG